jgi:hypothetical protein
MVQLSVRIGYCDFSCTALTASRYNAQYRSELLGSPTGFAKIGTLKRTPQAPHQ